MVFSSLTFLYGFLTLVLVFSFLLPKRARWQNLLLLLVSLFFYGWGEPVYVGIMLLSILIDYSHGLLVERCRADDRKARWFVGQSVVFNLLLLGFFKYWDFLAENLSLLPGISLPKLGLPLPLGISFFTFQTMSYTIDVYRQDAPVQKNPVTFGAYVTLFPQLIAGPIVRYKSVADQLESRREDLEKFVSGVQRFTVGAAKKVLLANAIGQLWDQSRCGMCIWPRPPASSPPWGRGWASPPSPSSSTSTSPATPTWPSAWGGCSGLSSWKTSTIPISPGLWWSSGSGGISP